MSIARKYDKNDMADMVSWALSTILKEFTLSARILVSIARKYDKNDMADIVSWALSPILKEFTAREYSSIANTIKNDIRDMVSWALSPILKEFTARILVYCKHDKNHMADMVS